MTDNEKNLKVEELHELLKEQVIGFLGIEFLSTSNGNEFLDLASIGTEASFLLLSNIAAITMLRLVVAGVSIEESKEKMKNVFNNYTEDTVEMAAKRIDAIHDMLQGKKPLVN